MAYTTWTEEKLKQYTEKYGQDATIRLMATTGRLAVVFLKHPEKLDTIAVHGMLHNEGWDEIGRVSELDLENEKRMVSAINKAINIDGYTIRKGARVFNRNGEINKRYFGDISWDSLNKTVLIKPENCNRHRSINCHWAKITEKLAADSPDLRDIHLWPFMEHRIVYPERSSIPVSKSVLRQKDINVYMKRHKRKTVVLCRSSYRVWDFATQEWYTPMRALIFKGDASAVKCLNNRDELIITPCGVFGFSSVLPKNTIMLSRQMCNYDRNTKTYTISDYYRGDTQDLLQQDFAEYRRQISLGLITKTYEVIS